MAERTCTLERPPFHGEYNSRTSSSTITTTFYSPVLSLGPATKQAKRVSQIPTIFQKSAAGVCVFAKRGNMFHILLGKDTKTNRWGFAKGKGERGESLLETASRELEEEFHINISVDNLRTWPCLIDIGQCRSGVHVFAIFAVKMPWVSEATFIEKAYKVYDDLTLFDYKWVPLWKIVADRAQIDIEPYVMQFVNEAINRGIIHTSSTFSDKNIKKYSLDKKSFVIA